MRWKAVVGAFTVGFAVGVPAGLVTPMVASARLADAEREVMNCKAESTTDAISPDKHLHASLTRFDCSMGMSYEYKLRLEPAGPGAKGWFLPMNIDANGDGRTRPTMEWTDSRTLIIYSLGEVASGTYNQRLGPFGYYPNLYDINLTTIFSRFPKRS